MRVGGDDRTGRRELLATGVAGVATALGGCAGLRSDRRRDGALASQVDAVASATEQYADPQSAVEAGFRATGPVAPGQGWHFVNEARVQAAAEEGVDRSTPQVLTYDTDMTLAAVEWAVPAGAVDEPPDLFDDDGAAASEEWHEHATATHVLADGNGRADDPRSISFDALTTNDNWAEFRPPDRDLSAGDEVRLDWGSTEAASGDGERRVVDAAATHPTLVTLHAWVHRENPEGVFSLVHPEVAGGASHDH